MALGPTKELGKYDEKNCPTRVRFPERLAAAPVGAGARPLPANVRGLRLRGVPAHGGGGRGMAHALTSSRQEEGSAPPACGARSRRLTPASPATGGVAAGPQRRSLGHHTPEPSRRGTCARLRSIRWGEPSTAAPELHGRRGGIHRAKTRASRGGPAARLALLIGPFLAGLPLPFASLDAHLVFTKGAEAAAAGVGATGMGVAVATAGPALKKVLPIPCSIRGLARAG